MNPKRLAKSIKILLLFMGVLSSVFVSAQSKITGRITSSEDKQPIVGATVNIKGTGAETVSDNEGNFQVSVGPGDVLIISYTGFQTREIVTTGQASINVILSPSNNSLNEVVVTGYTTQLRKDITGSVATVNVAAARKLPVSSSEQLLQGQASGVNVLTSGVPGGANFVSIRGIPSFGNSSPLYVIDGVQSTSMSDVNPNDIESISVLKDAGAAAIYGFSGGKGVIVITTKKGRPGTSTINYDGFYGVTQPLQGNVFHLVGVQEIAKFNFLVNPQSQFFAGGQIPDFGYQQGGGAKGFANAGDSAVNPAKY